MRPENAIEVKDVRKSFRVRDDAMSVKDLIVYHNKHKKESREILHGISFDVKKGEAVGIIGRNGSGKSTTLKLLTKILHPNSGNVEVEGRVSCLIELGAGFHPDMSGRENIYVNASIFGLDRKETEKRIEDIIEFSEIRPFIDQRVRNYSSGMYLRLAFAIATSVDADVMIVDEILAVGDIGFQDKCLRRFRHLIDNGMTLVFVSQSPEQVLKICSRAIWIDDGTIRMDGPAETVCEAYEQYMLGPKEDRLS